MNSPQSTKGLEAGAGVPGTLKRWLRPGQYRRYLAPAFITAILLGAHVSFGILEGWEQVLLAIVAAMLTESLLGRLTRGSWPNLASAYISGISISILTRSPAFWPFALGSMISIGSKYVLRVRGRHLWNPSNFGICALFFLASFAVAPLSVQWGNALWPMVVIWVLGFFIVRQVRRLHISVTYVLSFFALAAIRSWLTDAPFLAEVAPITGPMYQLFVFFMITDPKTTVSTTRGRCIVAVLIAVMELFLRLAEVIYAPFYALFIVGPIAMAIEIYREGGPASAAPAA